MSSSWTFAHRPGQLVSTAIHAGHDIRPDVRPCVGLAEPIRLMEEDPYTDRILPSTGTTVVVHSSRFEVDLNRERDASVYLRPDDAWGLDVWARPLPDAAVDASRRLHDDFYAGLASHLDRLSSEGPFLVLDVHSYNHRRDGATAHAADAAGNPEVNVGTAALDRRRWGPAVNTFMTHLGSQTVNGHRLDVRENVRFQGGHLSRWVVDNYPKLGCVLSIEFKKTFMDEWTGEYDPGHVEQLRAALDSAVQPTLTAVAEVA